MRAVTGGSRTLAAAAHSPSGAVEIDSEWVELFAPPHCSQSFRSDRTRHAFIPMETLFAASVKLGRTESPIKASLNSPRGSSENEKLAATALSRKQEIAPLHACTRGQTPIAFRTSVRLRLTYLPTYR